MYKHLVMVMAASALLAFGCGDDAGDDDANGNAGKGEAGASDSGGSGGKADSAGSGGTSDSGGAGGTTSGSGDIIDTAVAAGSFTKLAGALTKTGLVEALQGKGPFTVFAPNDDAFAAFEKANPGVLAGLSDDQLAGVLKYHVLAGVEVASSDLVDGHVAATLQGPVVLIDLSGDTPKINDANVITADVQASNGVIHVIDTILLPPDKDIVETAVAAGDFTALAGALSDADLVDTLKGDGPFTVFAPTDDAFGELAAVPTGDALADVLRYHVVAGAVGSGDLKAGKVETLLAGKSVSVDLSSGVKIDAAKVTRANIIATNGVIHVIDKVLIPN